MQAAVESLVHTFILSNFISNTFHCPSCKLLHHIVLFWAFGLLLCPFNPQGIIAGSFAFHLLIHFSDDKYSHLPDVRMLQGLLDLISGCTLVVLGNVLDFRTYSAPNQLEGEQTTAEQARLWRNFDWNDIPGDEHMAICYARGVVLTVFDWIRDWCIIKTPDSEVIDDLPSMYMMNLLSALLNYKQNAVVEDLQGAPHCVWWMLLAQVFNVTRCDKCLMKFWDQSRKSTSLQINIVNTARLSRRIMRHHLCSNLVSWICLSLFY
jgi:hypothetical protein